MNPLISVIVPIYKVEKYLSECVDSILHQTYSNIEIILVDDGSPDACGAICDAYQAQDERIIVIHKENGGLSDARNAGLKIAKGAYFNFVDSDDRLPVNAIERLFHMMVQHNAQMVIGGFERFRDDSGEVFFSTDTDGEKTTVMTRLEAIEDFFRDGCQAWAVLYERKIHEGIYFPKGEINEDEAIIFQLYDRCDTVVVTNAVVYSYRNRAESITTTSFSKKKLIWQAHCKANCAFIQQKYPTLLPYAYARYRGSLLWTLTELAMQDDLTAYQEEIRSLMEDLRSQKENFAPIPFQLKRDKLRYLTLQNLGFSVYRTLLRAKRGANRESI